jgi:calnexin
VFEKKWIRSKATKDGADEMIAKYDGEWTLEASTKNALVNDLGLVMKSKAKHAAIAARLKKPFVFDDKTFIVQYELNFQVIPPIWQNNTHFYLNLF